MDELMQDRWMTVRGKRARKNTKFPPPIADAWLQGLGISSRRPASSGAWHRRMLWIGVGLWVWMAGTGVGLQQVWSQSTNEAQTARRIYIEGARFLQQKRYEEASVQFRLAYKLLSRQYRNGKTSLAGALRKLRYFLGLCYFKMKAHKKARRFLRLYLRTKGVRGPRSLRAQRMLAETERQIALLPKPRPRPRVVKPPPRPRTIIIEKRVGPPQMRWRAAPFVILGLGVATLAAAGALGFVTNNTVGERDSLHQNLLDASEPFSTSVADAHRRAETFALVTNSLWIAGGVLSATGVILIFTVGRTPVEPAKTTKTIQPASQSLSGAGVIQLHGGSDTP